MLKLAGWQTGGKTVMFTISLMGIGLHRSEVVIDCLYILPHVVVVWMVNAVMGSCENGSSAHKMRCVPL